MYNLNVQRQVTPTTLLEIGYSGNRGLHLVRSGEANPVINPVTRERINPNFGSIPLIVTDAISNYNALQLSVLRRFSEQQDGQLQFSVSDTGVGLPAEKMDQIFSAFFTTKPQGSGMGLAISRSIVESHGGQLWACTNSGGGATFHFTLPIQVTESSPLVA
jgi:nitrogen fixation/metabolism regulation signal transduction histidine kinase